MASSLTVFGWHNVEGTWCFPAARGAGIRGLERQMRALRASTNIMPLSRALDDLTEGRPLPPRAVAVTFDDGYRDNLTLAGPLLARMGVPATCFLVPGILSGDVVPWWERLGWAFAGARVKEITWADHHFELGTARERYAAFTQASELLKRRNREARDAQMNELCAILDPKGDCPAGELFLDWSGAREIRKYMSIGSHSMYHAILSEETVDAQRQDLADSRTQLIDEIGADVRVLAYPNGTTADFTPDTAAAAERAGYTHAVTTERGVNKRTTERFEIRRWCMRPDWGAVEFAKVPRDRLRGILPLRAQRSI